MSASGCERAASGKPMAGSGIEAAIAPPIIACAVAVIKQFVVSISIYFKLHNRGVFDNLLGHATSSF